jgi:hypothetical protein
MIGTSRANEFPPGRSADRFIFAILKIPFLTMIKRLAHACLFSTNLERTKSFYCAILGLQVKFAFLKNGRLFGFYLEVAEDQFIEVFVWDHAQKNEEPHIG